MGEHRGQDIDPALRAELALREQMLDASVDCIKVIDLEGRLLHMNLPGRVALGVSDAEAAAGYGMKWLPLLPPAVRDRGRRALRRAREGHPARFAGMSTLVEDGEQRTQHWDNILTPLEDESGRVTAILCVSREVTLQREAERKLRRASERDALTGLLNRRSFRARLAKAVLRARGRQTGVGLVLVDLDHFKTVNDTLGHPAGDRLLQVFAQRLADCLPEGAISGRLGGDEFGVAIEGAVDAGGIHRLAELIRSQLDAPIIHEGHQLAGGMSLGCALLPQDAADEPGLMRRADIALSEVKTEGRGGIRLFNSRMQRSVDRAARELSLARKVLGRGAVVPHYQPKVSMIDGRLLGFEALLRWRSDDGTLRPPAEIAEAFEHYDLATGLAEQMHLRVLQDMRAWRSRGLRSVPVAVNVAPIELLDGGFGRRLLTAARSWGVPAELIELELPESVLQERGHDVAASALRPLKDAGVRLFVDDFGTGYGSLSGLVDNRIDGLKIDRSFVARLGKDPALVRVVEAICSLGGALHLDVVAEGVETREQRELLRSIGCLIGQGLLFSEPLDSQRAAQLLERSSAPLRTADWGRVA